MMGKLNKRRIRKISDEETDVQEGVIELLQEVIDDKTKVIKNRQKEMR